MSVSVAMNKDQWDPEFLKAIPIMKTRSGMQVRDTDQVSVVFVIAAKGCRAVFNVGEEIWLLLRPALVTDC